MKDVLSLIFLVMICFILIVACEEGEGPTVSSTTTSTTTSTSSTTSTTIKEVEDDVEIFEETADYFYFKKPGMFHKAKEENPQFRKQVKAPFGQYTKLEVVFDFTVGNVLSDPMGKGPNKYALLYVQHGGTKDAYAYVKAMAEGVERQVMAKHGINMKWVCPDSSKNRKKYEKKFVFVPGHTYRMYYTYDTEKEVELKIYEKETLKVIQKLGFAIIGKADCKETTPQKVIEVSKPFLVEFGYVPASRSEMVSENWEYGNLEFKLHKKAMQEGTPSQL